jgi:capsular polysaccharide biosynthesis protein
MEIKEYFSILKKQKEFFIGIIFIVISLTLAYFFFRPVSFETALFLNITRSGSQTSDGYKYDNFYRLQADEKFAETLVWWLKSPRVVTDINSMAGKALSKPSLKRLGKIFEVDKLSAQIVSVKFSASDQITAKKTAEAIVTVLKKSTAELNAEQKENTWFEIIAQEPIILESKVNFGIIFLAALLAGIFLGFWGVMIRHYLK